MWSCHKCGKPVYFAERKQSIGFDWHPDCLRCEECGKVLKPGQHAEHKGVPYCHVPCYGALFGPQLFGHGTRVESHSSFGKMENKSYGGISRIQLDSKLKAYNQHSENKNGGLKCREVNGRAVLEGVLKVYWGINSTIHLKEDDDQRVFVAVRKKTYRRAVSNGVDFEHISFCDSDSDEYVPPSQNTEASSNASVTSEPSPVADSVVQNLPDTPKYLTVPSKLEPKDLQWDELDELLQVERKLKDHEKPYQTLPPTMGLNISATYNAKEFESLSTPEDASTAVMGAEGHNGTAAKGGDASSSADDAVNKNDSPSSSKSTAIRRRPGRRFDKAKLKRRCSINGHYYNRETSVFTPPYGSLMTVWATSLVNTQEVIKMLLEKYRVESQASNFAIYIVKDNGERKRLREDESPLLTRVILGPHEEVARLFLVDAEATAEISPAVAQFIRFSQAECQAILDKYAEEEEREAANIRAKYKELRRRIRKRMQDLKVKL